METKVVVICIVLGILGVLSAILAFAAEGTKIKGSELQFTININTSILTCSYPDKQEATKLGIAAAILLLVAKITINIATGCFCCKKHEDISAEKRRSALISYILCWLTFLAGFIMLLTSAAVNSHRNHNSCNVVRDGVFVSGGFFCLAAVLNGILCYWNLSSKDKNSWGSHQNQGIAMGQPQQFPQQMGYPRQQV